MEYHLVKESGEWQLREQGSREALLAADTKSEAIDKLQDYMDSREGSVAIHGVDGRIREHRSYSPSEGPQRFVRPRTLGIIGVVALAAATAACVAWYYRDQIPTDRLRRLL